MLNQHFTGLCIYDIEKSKYISEHQADLQFTPASNAKLLTLYATLKTFGDSLPSLLCDSLSTGDLILQPVGDPTFLYSPFARQPIFEWLQQLDTVSIHWPKEVAAFGPGWAWDDFSYGFQTERSWWPMYGNRITVQQTLSDTIVTPAFFADQISYPTDSLSTTGRLRQENRFSVVFSKDTIQSEKQIPFIYSQELFEQLLADTLGHPVKSSKVPLLRPDTLFSYPIDTVLAHMLKPSDNFLAEQLLMMCAWKSGSPDVQSFIRNFKNQELQEFGPMVWKDGSGLSRYNLISPRSQVKLLLQCLDEFGWERITKLLPTGGEGTLEHWYNSSEPFIFAKTGTLSNNHNLSGYLITKSGKKLIFSFMNNHYLSENNEVKTLMQDILLSIHHNY